MSDGLPSDFSFREIDGAIIDEAFDFVDPTSVSGAEPLRFFSQNVKFRRHLYKVDGIDLQWIGVVVPDEVFLEPTPHIFLHPSAAQAGINDADYGKLGGGWDGVFDAYSYWMGAQVAAVKKAQQALIIPLYKSGQAQHFGNFNTYWKPVVTALLTDAVNKKSPLIIYGSEVRFERIFTSSFSLGIAAHMHFQTKAVGLSSMTDRIFDLDGKFGPGQWSFWSPAKSIIYQDRAPEKFNPKGNVYKIGGRWKNAFDRQSRAGRNTDTHWLTAQYMLFHGITMHSAGA